jgi:hypothetical protein
MTYQPIVVNPRAFQSEEYGPEGEFLLALSADDYQVVMHALVVAGGALEPVSSTTTYTTA